MAACRAGGLPQPERAHMSPVDAEAVPSTSCSARQQSSYRLRRTADLSSRRRPACLPSGVQCLAVNRASWQTLSQVEAARPLDLELLPACHPASSETVVLHPLQHTLISRNGHAGNVASLSHDASDSSYSQPVSVGQQGELEHDRLMHELHSVRDIPALELVVNLHQHRMAQAHIRFALIQLLQLYDHATSMPEQQQQQQQQQQQHTFFQHQQAAQSCLQRLFHCWAHPSSPSATSSSSLSHNTYSNGGGNGSLAVGSWSVNEQVLFAKAMAKVAWCHEATWCQLCSHVMASVYTLEPRDASNMLWAAARFRRLHASSTSSPPLPPSPSDLTLLAERVWAGAGRLAPSHIAQALHSLATLDHLPPKSCLEGILTGGLLRRATDWQGRDIACAMWALATLGVPPTGELLETVLNQSERAMRSFGTGASLATMVWSLATMGRAPPRPWMEHYLWQVQRRVNTCDAQTISMIMWSLAKLRYRPPQAWAAAVLRAAGQRMHAPQPQHAQQAPLEAGQTVTLQRKPAAAVAASADVDAAVSHLAAAANAAADALVVATTKYVDRQQQPQKHVDDQFQNHKQQEQRTSSNGIGSVPPTTILWPPGEGETIMTHSDGSDSDGMGSYSDNGSDNGSDSGSGWNGGSVSDVQDAGSDVSAASGNGSNSRNSSGNSSRRLWQRPTLHTDASAFTPHQQRLTRPTLPPSSQQSHQPAIITTTTTTSTTGTNTNINTNNHTSIAQPSLYQPQHPPLPSQTDATTNSNGHAHSHPPLPSTPHPIHHPPTSSLPPHQQTSIQRPPQLLAPLKKGTGASPRTFTTYLWALARLQLLPRSGYLHRLCDAMAPGLGSFAPGDLALMLWALQSLRYVPAPHWMSACTMALKARLPSASAHAVLTAMHALAGYSPVMPVAEDLYHVLCHCLARHLPRLSTNQLSGACSSLSRIASAPCLPAPPAPLSTALSHLVLTGMPTMRVRDVTTATLGLARLHARHGGVPALTAPFSRDMGSVMQGMTSVIRQRVTECDHKDLTQAVVACSTVGYHPGQEWLNAHEAAVSHLVTLGHCTPMELSPLIQAYDIIGHHPARLLSAAGSLRARAMLQQREAAAAAVATGGSQRSNVQKGRGQEAGVAQEQGRGGESSWQRSMEHSQQQQQQQQQQRPQHAVLMNMRQLPPEQARLRRQLLTVEEQLPDQPSEEWVDTEEATSIRTVSNEHESRLVHTTRFGSRNGSSTAIPGHALPSNTSAAPHTWHGASTRGGAIQMSVIQRQYQPSWRSSGPPPPMRITLAEPSRLAAVAPAQADAGEDAWVASQHATGEAGDVVAAADGQWRDTEPSAGDVHAAWSVPPPGDVQRGDQMRSPEPQNGTAGGPGSTVRVRVTGRQKNRARQLKGLWRAPSVGLQP